MYSKHWLLFIAFCLTITCFKTVYSLKKITLLPVNDIVDNVVTVVTQNIVDAIDKNVSNIVSKLETNVPNLTNNPITILPPVINIAPIQPVINSAPIQLNLATPAILDSINAIVTTIAVEIITTTTTTTTTTVSPPVEEPAPPPVQQSLPFAPKPKTLNPLQRLLTAVFNIYLGPVPVPVITKALVKIPILYELLHGPLSFANPYAPPI